MPNTFTITNTTKGKLPRLPFLDMKEAVLGTRYDLSLVLIGERRSRTITKRYKHKDTASNVLSFPIDKTSGEIFITPNVAAREAKRYGKTPKQHIGYLFIHGMLHLSGLSHGSRMEAKEKTLSRRFSV